MDQKEQEPTVFNDKNEKIIENAFYGSLRLAGRLIALLTKMIPGLVLYAFLALIYLGIYEYRGFETAIILLLVGVIVSANRRNSRQNQR